MKFISLLKAVLSQDMNLFKYSFKNSSKITKFIVPIILFLCVAYAIGFYAYNIAEVLFPLKLTYVMLSMFLFMVTILTFMEGIYKSQNVLFDVKDNDLLFSLPISKKTILFVRIIKLILFDYLYSLMFILPAFVIYIYFEKPGINFYIISLIMTFLIPIIPTVLSCFVGYIIRLISNKFKMKKTVQTLLTFLIFIAIFMVSSNMNKILLNIASSATSINDILKKVYYPIGIYISLIDKFNLILFIKLLLINFISLFILIIICNKYYFIIIYDSKNRSIGLKKLNSNSIKVRRPITSLVVKELKRYFSSTVYMFNTFFGILLFLFLTIILCFKGEDELILVLSNLGITSNLSLNILYYIMLLFSLMFTSITSSSISLEGKSINITKSLPIECNLIFNSKIILCYIVEFPFIWLSIIIFELCFKFSFIYFLELIILSVLSIFISSVVGLIINLKYPKLDASNDTEVVKQSMSSMISLFIGFIIFILSTLLLTYFTKWIGINILIYIHLLLFVILSLILYFILLKFGSLDYKKLSV